MYICRILFKTWKIFPLCIVPSSSSNSFQLSYSVKSNEKGFFAQIRRELLKGKISIIYSPDPTTNSNTYIQWILNLQKSMGLFLIFPIGQKNYFGIGHCIRWVRFWINWRSIRWKMLHSLSKKIHIFVSRMLKYDMINWVKFIYEKG